MPGDRPHPAYISVVWCEEAPHLDGQPTGSSLSPRTPCSRLSERIAKPTTSPASGRLNGGPWRQGVAVTSIGDRAGALRRVAAQGSSPRAWPPRRFALATVVTTAPADGGNARPGDVEVVAVVIVCNQHRVDRSDVGGGDRRPR